MSTNDLQRVPLHEFHLARGAKMVPFAGYEMPVQYSLGVLKEHLHTRAAAGLFDVSHMGQMFLKPKSGAWIDVAKALEKLVPVDVQGLKPFRQRYAFFTTPEGGIYDDLMIANLGTHLMLVVNAACKHEDEKHLRRHLEEVCEIEVLHDRALLALQGPKAEAVLASLSSTTAAMQFMDVGPHSIMGLDCIVSRSGYTGEDGYEISVEAKDAGKLAEALLAHPEVECIGLGARDSLRLEAGLCLYGNDIDTTTSPVEAALLWAMQKVRRSGGEREGGFLGAEIILKQIQEGVTRKRVGLQPESRPVRAEALLYLDETSSEPIGKVTSGGFGPSASGPVAMGYLPVGYTQVGTKLFADVRGQRHPVTVAALPFVAHQYKK